jgi:two-component system, NtrC family, sensor kinase
MSDLERNTSSSPISKLENTPYSQRRVIVTEDDLTSRQLLEALLSQMGFIVESFENGEGAWRRLNEDNPPHFLIVDWMMPEMDGLQLVKKVMSLNSPQSFYIIMLTSLNTKQHLTSALNAGANDFVVKPYSYSELLARINVAMRVLETEAELISYGSEFQKLAEERAQQLLQADKMATIGTLAAGIAHEINNPSTFISGNLKVLDECIQTITQAITPEMQATFDKSAHFALSRLSAVSTSIRKGVDRISAISSGLKSYSRKSDPRSFQYVDIESCVDQALELCRNKLKYNISIDRTHSGESKVVWADEQQLVQIVVNLLLNAVDALHGLPNALISVTTLYDDQSVCLTVEDNGPGISDDVLKRIFDPFFTTKDVGKGTGLGLSISRNIAVSHGGDLWVEAGQKLTGAAFKLRLPAIAERHSRVTGVF